MNLLTTLSDELVELVARTAPSVVSVEHYRGHGSGVVLAPDGFVLTNCHVVRRVRRDHLGVGFADGAYLEGRVVGLDPRTDLAVVAVEATGLASLALADTRRVRVGQLVVAIGNPFRFERSMSLGVVSALDRSLPGPGGTPFEGLIQTDAAINPGNSGGPLLDAAGAVVGINTAIIPWAQGIGFAVPAHTASWVSSVLISKGEVKRPFLGIAARGVELVAAVSRELGQPRAVRVFEVNPGTPAAAAGLKDGDLLLAADGAALTSVDDLQRVMVYSEGDAVRLELWRDRRRVTLFAPARKLHDHEDRSMDRDPRYPIGKFKKPERIDARLRRDLIREIAGAPAAVRAAVKDLADPKLDTPYREGGWTVRQVVHHLPDSHMNAYIRFKLTLTESEPTIKSYEEALWAELPEARTGPVSLSLDLLDALHRRWVTCMDELPDKTFERRFQHPDSGLMSLDHLVAIYAWHGRHHTAQITTLAERLGWT